jgi:hypothetical protein
MREVYDFAVNRMTGPASKLPHDGFERPSHCQFGPDGALYVVDFGIIHIAPERGGIRHVSKARGMVPPPPKQVPVYTLQGLVFLAGLIGVGALTTWVIKKLRGGYRSTGR